MQIVTMIFWLLLGLWFTGWFAFPQHELILGLLALIIGIVQLVELLRR